MVTGGADGTARVWDPGAPGGGVRVRETSGGRFRRQLDNTASTFLTSACPTPDGRFAPVSRRTPVVEMWDLDDGVRVGRPEERQGGVNAVRTTPDGQFALTACDWTIRVWEIEWELP